MKRLLLVIASLSILLLFISSCKDDFLVKSPPDALTDDDFYNSAERAELGVNAVYESVAGEWDRELIRVNNVPAGDILLSNTEPLEYNNFTYHPAIQEFQFIWTNQYEGIGRANTIIAALPDIEMDANLKNRYLGEARFLRALNYFTLSNLFGDLPIVTEPFETTDDVLIARSPIASVYELIIDDLEFARENLPRKSEYSNSDLGRATWGAATALLGKVYLYDNDFPQAESLFGEVIDSGEYALMDNFEHVWHREYENNVESIFEIQYADIGGGGASGRNGSNLPAVNGATGASLATQIAVDGFEAGDPRLQFSVFRAGDTFAPHIRADLAEFSAAWSATGYSVKKGMVPILYTNGGGGNSPLIRYADVLLMYAEAANELDLRDEARDAINQVRQRPTVDLPELTVGESDSYQEVFDAIVQERRAELVFEAHRFNDLRRWGLAQEVLGERGYESRHRYFPIPQLEIDINDQLTQNPGWGQN